MTRNTQIFIVGASATAGLYALVRVLRGKQISTLPFGYGTKLKRAITVSGSPEQLYDYWRDIENLPKLFDNVLSVQDLGGGCSRWNLRGPGGITLQWNAEITVDRRNEMIGWRSLDGADLDNAGSVRFERAAGGRGTVVRVALQYNPPAGRIGAALSALLGEKPASQLEEALRKFKRVMETGEIPTKEPVEVASEDSFPASDAPAWTGTTGPGG